MSASRPVSRRSTSLGQASASQRQSVTSRPHINTKDGYAAIDFGSTSTRAYLTTVNNQTKQTNGYRVQKTGVDDDKKKRFLRGEWPSKGCPFEPPYPVGYEAAGREHANKRDRSLKSFVWFLADDDDQHPYTRDLKDYHDELPDIEQKRNFRKRLVSMLVRHLTIVADQIGQEAILRQTKIHRLVFCVPNAWDKPNFQAILRPIMDKVARGIETYCVFESEALSQFILHQHPYLLMGHDFALVCDFGGHFMGGSLFQFCRSGPDDDQPAFFSLPQGNFGIRGGSQLWEDHIRPCIDSHIATFGLSADKESVLRVKFLDAFFISKNEVDSSFYENNMPMRLVVSITDAFPDDTNLYPLYLKPAQIREAWELGFRASIELALDKILLLPVSSRDKTVIILSGGSMQNYQARTEIQAVCEKYGIECQAVGFDVNVESSKWMVCEGAATSEACAMSVQDFFRRGAALAIQSYTKDGHYKTDADILFYGVRNAPKVSFSSGHSPTEQLEQHEYDEVGNPVEIELSGHAHNRFRIVCDPLYQRNRHRYPRGCISILSDDATENNNCYDIWDMSRNSEVTSANGAQFGLRLSSGKYLIAVECMTYHDNSVDATLCLRLTRAVTTASTQVKAGKRLRGRDVSASQESYTFDVPLTSCGPSNLVLLDLDLVKKRLWKPRSRWTPLSRSVLDQQLAKVDTPAAKGQGLVVPPVTYDSTSREAVPSQPNRTLGPPSQSLIDPALASGRPSVSKRRRTTSPLRDSWETSLENKLPQLSKTVMDTASAVESIPSSKRPRIGSPSVKPYDYDWEAICGRSSSHSDSSAATSPVAPSIPKQETNRPSPMLGETFRRAANQYGTYDLALDSDSGVTESDDDASGTIDSEIPGKEIDFGPFPIMTGPEK